MMPVQDVSWVSTFHISGYSPLQIAKQLWAEIRQDDLFGRAAQLAYYFFLALFPFLIFVIASLSAFGFADRGRALLFAFFAQVLPAPAFHLVTDTFDQILRAGGPLKVSAGLVFSLFSASMGMNAVMDTLNAAYNVKETRSFIQQYAVSIGLTCAVALLLIVSLLIVIASRSFAIHLGAGAGFLAAMKIAVWPVGIALLMLAFSITYYFAPDLKTRQWHWITPGAVIGVVILVLVFFGLRVYLHFTGSYTETYGALGAVVILLLCSYVCGLAILFGGIFNGVLERHSPHKGGASRNANPLAA
jgi:membrane protein